MLLLAEIGYVLAQATDVRPSAFARPIVLTSDAPLHLVELPYDLYAVTRPTLADLRVFDADDRPVPYAVFGGLRQDNWVEDTDRVWFRAVLQGDPPTDDRYHDYYYDVGSSPPVDRVRFTLPQPDTAAPAVLSSSATPNGPWTPRYQGLLYRLRRNGDLMTSLPTPLPLTHDRYWRLRIDPSGGGLGAGEVGLELRHRPEQIAFITTGRAPYRLVYGHAATSASPDATNTALDLTALLDRLPPGAPLGDLPDATLGAAYALDPSEVSASSSASSPSRFSPGLRSWRWPVLGVLVAFGLLVARRRRRSARTSRRRS
ncbi:MAG: DUF3999 family protein [Trueperaceae bacterium]|nr:DUF3999 family protein [Trueperaceae bacterium]